MSMKVSTRQVDGITILDLSGRITLGEGSITLRAVWQWERTRQILRRPRM